MVAGSPEFVGNRDLYSFGSYVELLLFFLKNKKRGRKCFFSLIHLISTNLETICYVPNTANHCL